MSLRKAINEKCRQCTVDPLDVGTAAQQIACCTADDCGLHPVRPVTTTIIPTRLLEAWNIKHEQLDTRARALVQLEPTSQGEAQNGHILSTESIL